MAEAETQRKNLFRAAGGALYKPLLFFILILLPLITLWLVLNSLQGTLKAEKEREIFDEMSEITAHFLRLANPKSFYSGKIRRFSENLKYAEALDEIANPCPKQLEIFLFTKEGKRVNWPVGKARKRKVSESYAKCLLRLSSDSGAFLSKTEQKTAFNFSGNRLTPLLLVRNAGQLINFIEFGLKKYGIWLKTTLPDKKEGYLLAWLKQNAINRYELSQNAACLLQSKTGPLYTFAWEDLKNHSINGASKGLRLSKSAANELGTVGLKLEFKLKDTAFTVADTEEGIRLITAFQPAKEQSILDYYHRFLLVLIPAMLLLLVWKSVFKVTFNFSAAKQFVMIFGFTALTGGAAILTGIFAYQYQKQHSLINEYKSRASNTLEKLDRDYSAAFSEHLKQYRHLIKQLKDAPNDPKTILEPLAIAQKDDRIIFASYSDANGNMLFKAPEGKKNSSDYSLNNFLSEFISKTGARMLKTFNSSRLPSSQDAANQGANVLSIVAQSSLAFSDKIISSLLEKRSTMQNIVIDGLETITFMDLVIGPRDIASGSLFVIYDRQKTELNYLALKDSALSFKNGFALAAFPKQQSAKEAYYPHYSISQNVLLQKMQDLMNQTRILCCKEGSINKQRSLIVGLPGHNLKTYNLFLILPMKPILSEAGSLSRFFVVGTVLAVGFICFLSLILTNTLIKPITTMARNASLLSYKPNKTKELSLQAPVLSSELESISTAMTDLILKLREFNKGRSVKNYLLPHAGLKSGGFFISAFQFGAGCDEREIYSYLNIDNENVLIFITRTPFSGIEASIALSMTNMAANLISKELNVTSPYHILKDLDEYFRINIRTKIAGDFAAAVLNTSAKTLSFCGCGDLRLVYISIPDCSFKSFGFEAQRLNSKEFYSSANRELTLNGKDIALVVSPALNEGLTKRLSVAAPLLANKAAGVSSLDILRSEVKRAFTRGLNDIGSLIIIEPETGAPAA